MNDRKGLVLGLGAAALLALGIFALRSGSGLLGSLGKLVVAIVIAAAVLVVLVVALVVVLAFRSSGDQQSPNGTRARTAHAALDREEQALLDSGRRSLLSARQSLSRMERQSIRTAGEDACRQIEILLKTLREKPETRSKARQFLIYYIPTLDKILAQYRDMERNQVATQELTADLEQCLRDIAAAARQQQQNLFAPDVMDLTAEMDVMTMVCRRDGLLPAADDGEESLRQ